VQAIDIHAHYLPPLLIEKIKKNSALFPYVKLEDTQEGSYRFKIGNESWTRPVSPSLMNLEKRLPEMDQQGISLQINAGWMDIFGYSLDPKQGKEWSQFLNETLIEAIKSESCCHRFVPMATVPLQNGEAAAEVLKSTVEAGHYGVMIGTWIPGGEAHEAKDLDDPSLILFGKLQKKWEHLYSFILFLLVQIEGQRNGEWLMQLQDQMKQPFP
jgi:aminocarboxymuconate-semialdehyde decarboxylase